MIDDHWWSPLESFNLSVLGAVFCPKLWESSSLINVHALALHKYPYNAVGRAHKKISLSDQQRWCVIRDLLIMLSHHLIFVTTYCFQSCASLWRQIWILKDNLDRLPAPAKKKEKTWWKTWSIISANDVENFSPRTPTTNVWQMLTAASASAKIMGFIFVNMRLKSEAS